MFYNNARNFILNYCVKDQIQQQNFQQIELITLISCFCLGWRAILCGEKWNKHRGPLGESAFVQGRRRIEFPGSGHYSHEWVQSWCPSFSCRWEEAWRLHALVFARSHWFMEWFACCLPWQLEKLKLVLLSFFICKNYLVNHFWKEFSHITPGNISKFFVYSSICEIFDEIIILIHNYC